MLLGRFSRSLSLPGAWIPPVVAAASLVAVTGWLWGLSEFRLASIPLAFALVWASAVDIDRFILPDILTFPLIAGGLSMRFGDGFEAGLPYLIGAFSGYAVLALVASIYERRRGRAGLGMGDAKLFAAAGAWLGWFNLPLVLLIACMIALATIAVQAIIDRHWVGSRAVPFGPFISIGFWVVWLTQRLAD